jgi:putative AlgH/UPF0301 family transcriptional regulator
MTKRSLRRIVILFAAFPVVDSFLPRHYTRFHVNFYTAAQAKKDVDDEEEEIDVSNQDWRAFRAKLVMGSSSRSSAPSKRKVEEDDLDGIGSLFSSSEDDTLEIMTPLDPSQWAYDSGKVIETGAVILGGVEQDYGFGLRQQYFHKAAILVLDHDEHTFTKGIILNRPSDLTLDDAINPGVRWRMWFGGDVQGWTSDRPEIICLHTLNNTAVQRVSIPIINDIQWTSLDAAQRLVKAGLAKPTDFWVFCGYAGWGPQQLMGELDRNSWYMVATDSQTLLKELARLAANADPRDAGLETWSLLMSMIGRAETAQDHTGDFDDHMLKEWARQNLLSVVAGGGVDSSNFAVLSSQPAATTSPFDRIFRRVAATSSSVAQSAITAGTLVRATPTERSPFLLQGQEFHKSLVLILSDDENLTVGVILNRPGAKGLDVRVQEKVSGQAKKQMKVPLRYGGPYTVKGTEPLVWLHCNPALKRAKVGAPIGGSSSSRGTDDDGIWKCDAKDLIAAVGTGVATPEDFMVVAGVSVWPKVGSATGTPGDAGAFEPVAEMQIPALWAELVQQEVLTEENLNKNLILADRAWSLGTGSSAQPSVSNDRKRKKNGILSMGGLGEGYDEEDDDCVFQTDVKVSKLSDDALRSWVATFLLGAPSLGE